MNATLVVIPTSAQDRTIRQEIRAGMTVQELIDSSGSTFGYNSSMKVVINNGEVHDFSTTIQPNQTVTFRPGTKDRG